MLFLMQPGCSLPSLLQGHIACSQSTWSPPGLPYPPLQSYFPDCQSPACTDAQVMPRQVKAFCFLEPPDNPLCPFLQIVEVLLNGSMTIIWLSNTLPSSAASAGLLGVDSVHSSRFLKMLKYQPLGCSTSEKHLSDQRFCPFSVHLTAHFLRLYFQQFIYEDAMRDSVKSHSKAKINNTYCSPLIHQTHLKEKILFKRHLP